MPSPFRVLTVGFACCLALSSLLWASSAAPSAASADHVFSLLTSEQAEAFAAGADPEELILGDGRSLAEHLTELAGAGPEPLVFIPVDSCSVLRTTHATAGKMTADEIRAFLARGEATDLSGQGGAASGCGIPDAAVAVMLSVTTEQPDGSGRLKGWPVDAAQPGGDLVVYRTTTDGIAFFSLAVVGLCDLAVDPCTAGDFNFRAVNSGTHVRAEAAGYFVPALAGVVAGTGLLGGGSQGEVTLDVDPATVQTRVTGTCPTGASIAEIADDGTVVCEPDDDTLAALSCAAGEIAKWDGGAWVCAADETGSVTDVWVDEAGDTMTGPLDMGGNPIASVGDLTLDNTSAVFKGGQLFISEDIALDIVSLGRGALEANVSGTSNTAVGNFALVTNTDGSGNTALGYQALNANTTGSFNTALGRGALLNNTAASNNTAVGDETLSANTTGYDNTAVGDRALTANTTGRDNTAMGAGALSKNTEGTYNTAFGQDALRDNTTGNENTALGETALRDNTTGILNTAVGINALHSSTTGSRNTAVGWAASFDNAGGSFNTAVGDQALRYNTGSYNTALGDQAGRDATTGDFNIFVGAHVYGVAGDSNTIRIGSTQSQAFIAGISGTPLDPVGQQTPAGTVEVVVVNGTGQLGTASGPVGDADTLDGLDSSAFMPAGTDLWVDAGGDTMAGALDMATHPITSIGAAGTGFSSGGGLSLANPLTLQMGETISNATDQVITFSDGTDSLDIDLSGSVILQTGNAQQPMTVRLGTTSALSTEGAPLVLEGGIGQFSIETTGIPGGRIELEGGKPIDITGECALPNGNTCSGHARIAGGSATGNTCTTGGSVVLSGGSGNCGWGEGNVVVPASKFGIGTYRPDTDLHVDGSVKIADGTQGAGKVLTSDADGLASWAAVPAIPSGVILMWSGPLASIPTGWALCDGTNGTPDLRNRFIYGVDSGEDPGATGGADSYSLTPAQLPGHTHTFSTNTTGAHTHDLRGNQTAGSTDFVTMLANSAGAFDNRMDAAGDHAHSGTTDATGSGSAIDNRPAYVKLAFIMKI